MSRINSFKAKTLIGNQSIVGIHRISQSPPHYEYISDDNGASWQLVHPESVGAFTTKQDNNHIPIFENDLIKTPTGRFKVVFEDFAFKCIPLDRSGDSMPLSIFLDCEIIS